MRGLGVLALLAFLLHSNGQLPSVPPELAQTINEFVAELKADVTHMSGGAFSGFGGGGSSHAAGPAHTAARTHAAAAARVIAPAQVIAHGRLMLTHSSYAGGFRTARL